MDKIPKVYDEQNWIYSAFPTAGQKAPPLLSEIKKSPPGLGLMAHARISWCHVTKRWDSRGFGL